MASQTTTLDKSRSDVAAILVEMSQTVPIKSDLGHRYSSTPDNTERLSVSPSPPGSDDVTVIKVSNSDDEDMGMQSCPLHRELNESQDRASKMRHGQLRSANYRPDIRAGGNASGTLYAREEAETDRRRSVLAYRTPYANGGVDHTRASSLTILPSGPGFPTSIDRPSQEHRHSPSHSRSSSLIRPNTIEYLSSRAASLGEGRSVQPPDLMFRALQPTGMVRNGDVAMSEAELPECVRVQGNGRPSAAAREHDVTVATDRVAKRPRIGFGPPKISIADFKYRTIKAIQMPARTDLLPNQQPPEPTPDDLPYGNDIDYPTSMLIYWLDEKELTYTESSRRFRAMFPGEAANDDSIRKKHHNALIKLAKEHGLKPEEELDEPSKSVTRRGQQAGHRNNTIGNKVVYGAGAPGDVAGKTRRTKVSEPTAHRGFLKACICVWKDTSNVSFEEIQQRLASEYGWHMGANTVQKLYYSERGRVYDTYADASNSRAAGPNAEQATRSKDGRNPVWIAAKEQADDSSAGPEKTAQGSSSPSIWMNSAFAE